MHTVNTIRRRLHETVNYRLRTAAGGRLASLCRPATVAFLLTERCNARCVHCDIWKNKGPEERPSLEEWQRVLSDLRHWLGPVHVVFSGGEALLNNLTIELVRYGSALGLYIEVLTHGYWKDQQKIRDLALSGPSRVTISLDAIGETHSMIRGREGFFEKTLESIQTLRAIKDEERLSFDIRLKTVIMNHNLDEAPAVARFAHQNQLEIFYQPIEQNYNTEEDREWFSHSENWPENPATAATVVNKLIDLKAEGLPIKNTNQQLEAMIRYFQNPAALRVATQAHAAHERQLLCSALTMLQIQANGDVTVCTARTPVGSIRQQSIRLIWESRPQWWLGDCCLDQRL